MGQYDGIVLEYFDNANAAVPIISDDELFKKNLRSVFQKTLVIKREVVHSFQKPSAALRYLTDRLQRRLPTLLFCEGSIQGRPTTDFLATLKATHPELLVIALVVETRREDIAYLYEIGCNNVIAKPASANNIVEKMAFSIRPQGKLTEYVSAAKSFLQRREYQKVLTICRKILELKPGSPTALMLVGDVFLATGERRKAQSAYEEAHRNAELFIEPIKRLAEFHRDHDDEQHLHFLRKLDKLSPLHAGRKRDIGLAHMRRGEQPEAEQYFDKAMECARREAASIVSGMAESIANVVQEESPVMAEKYLSQALDAKKDNLTQADLETFNRLGIALKAQGKWQEAVDCYKKALGIAPRDEGLYYNLGMAYFEGRKSREAAKAFATALEISPTFYRGNEVVTTNLANAAYEARDFEGARRFATHALELNPKNSHALEIMRRISRG
ncbi:MAG: tetratricopeptide repeat protein [Desulfovibrionaceae bacterium]